MLKKNLRICIDWSKIKKHDYLEAMQKSVRNTYSVTVRDTTEIFGLLENAITDKIADREMFMKGIDYSYYYEQEVDYEL